MLINKVKSGITIHILIGIGIVTLIIFLFGFIKEVGIGHPVLYLLLTVSLIFKLLRIIFEWYHYAGIRDLPNKTSSTAWKVDILTTACPEEPKEMVEETLRAMVNIYYPHQNYLCDEGNDPYYQELCQKLGVHYVTRFTRENAKAGNINNGLKQATGDICVVLDPDHVPSPDFLDSVLPYFEDPEIGYVQVVQAYKNQPDSLIARAAAEQTYIFYGPFMRGMSHYGTAQAIGANCTFRRKALNSIGGHAPGLTEDMHTSMLLHAEGWKSVYVPKIVSHGLVPSTLSAYYKQQLKWSRGTFDLWFNVYPRLFNKLTWRQKIHYGILPLYYFLGIIALLDIIIPIYALLSEDYPWKMIPALFFVYFSPLIMLLISIRLSAQRWLYRPREMGLHLLGGILRVGTWWVYIVGFVYTLLNIKVPYIPTPKEHNQKNEFLLGLPNLLVALLSINAAIYGLHLDWQPYSFIMAFFAFSNGLVLLTAFIMGQNALLTKIYKFWAGLKYSFSLIGIQLSYGRLNRMIFRNLLFVPIITIFIALAFTLSFIDRNEVSMIGDKDLPTENELGGFYMGIYKPDFDKNSLIDYQKEESQTQHSFSIISTYLAWGADSIPVNRWESIVKEGAIPMITWEPWTNLFPHFADHPDLGHNRKVFHYIVNGYFDAYIDNMAISLRSLGYPVFLRFAHEMDNPMYPWSASGENTPEEFKEAWRYVHDRFESLGVQNVTWVWNPWKPLALETYFPSGKIYPESRYVDWIGITCLNYGLANPDNRWYTFEELYNPYQKKLKDLSINLPVMLAEFGSVSYGGDGSSWVNQALSTLKKDYPEVKSAVLFFSNQDENWASDWRPGNGDTTINWTYNLNALSSTLASYNIPYLSSLSKNHPVESLRTTKKSPIQGTFGKFSWNINGKPFYFKGICYNPEHDWRDGFLPLSRKQLKNDFRQIKSMGANTIRRYEPGIYDKNMFKVAEEEEMHVLYGFWFDPAIDYNRDTAAVAAYEKKVLKYVKKYKDQDVIIGWNIGNETWGLMKKHFTKPYLTLTRRAYLEFLERLAKKIHQIDPERPVFATEEHEHYQLASTLYEMRTHTPSIDILGINSYFESNLKEINSTFSKFDTLRPYVITEFGPKGYWSSEFGDFRYDKLIEVSSLSKAQWYERQWYNYIEKYKGFNLGGFAFSWRDRYEGTATWYGITDYKGRLKPAYYYLQKAWSKDIDNVSNFPDLYIIGPWYPKKPGETIWLAAGISNRYSGKLNFEWEIYDSESWKKVSAFKTTLFNKNYVELQVPHKKSEYRVYLHAVDSTGNVITASRPLLIE